MNGDWRPEPPRPEQERAAAPFAGAGLMVGIAPGALAGMQIGHVLLGAVIGAVAGLIAGAAVDERRRV